MDEESKCGNCYFWQKVASPPDLGSCRVRAPAIIPSMIQPLAGPRDTWFATSFPVVSAECWCGEFRHKNRMP